MSVSYLRTQTHEYPGQEVWAMEAFYDGKRWVITLGRSGVQWSHSLNAALSESQDRVCVFQSTLLWRLEYFTASVDARSKATA